MSINDEKYLEILLGLLDNIHDFHKLDKKNHCVPDYITHYLIDFYLYLDPTLSTVYPEYSHIFRKERLHMVDDHNFKNSFLKFLLLKKPNIGITVNDIMKQIEENFNNVFNVDFNRTNLNKLLNKKQILYIRIPLYYLIDSFLKNDIDNFDKILKFILEFMEVPYLDSIINKIKTNINPTINNITFPNTYFDDMSSDINEDIVEFKIVNTDKEIIDEAKTEGVHKYFTRGKHRLYINDTDTSLNFHMNKKKDLLMFMGAKYYVNNTKNIIYCLFDRILIKVLKNNVGREGGAENGLYQTICTLFRIIDQFEILYKNEKHKDDIFLNEKNIEYEPIITQFLNKILDNKSTFLKLASNDVNINNLVIRIDFDNLIDQNLLELNNIIFKILDIITDTKYKNKLLYNKKKIITSLDYYNIKSLETYNKIDLYARFVNILPDSKKNRLLKLFLICFITEPKFNNMKEIIVTTILEKIFIVIYKKYYISNSTNLMKGLIAFLLTGAKRYGDWIQAVLGKKHYFFVQTQDYYCSYYSLLIGAPVYIYTVKLGDDNLNNIKIYNYNKIPKFNNNYILNNFGIHRKINKTTSIVKDIPSSPAHANGILYFKTDTSYFKTPEISRNYFYKYIKYKIKYNKLKNQYLYHKN